VAIHALWLLALPVSRTVQSVALRRFHLQTNSFALWALQAPVPAMYNFHNRARLQAQPWDAPPMTRPVTETLNHFPVRLLTFGDSRPALLPEAARTELIVTSAYRGRSLTTRWRAIRHERGTRLDDEVVP
jgi:hypothetical protein